MKTVNMKIEDNDKKKIIVIKKFFSKDIILMLNLAETKTHMMKKTD